MTQKTFTQNKKVFHDYYVEESLEAGIVLAGTEVKSIRMGSVSLKDSYVSIKNGEAFLIGSHVSPYEKGNIFNKDPRRTRKLLLNKKEISYLLKNISKLGYTIVPIKMYLKKCYIKVELGICKGKKKYDKRSSDEEKSVKRRIERKIKEINSKI